ncbi:AraC family transcriptional regulator [Mycolicibacterium goodii]|uniref:AraC family transcriptional regulator n=1 Tax=Mycolicibacterium goodii TaxID=134601 RepID=UPI000C268C1D|nr:AraC family transcriptional regulator [Mycolicibacterium goodii]PJK18583.1 AraC family transcriptional regulator [Mycolicibacterium goodii]
MAASMRTGAHFTMIGGAPGVERLQASLRGEGFTPHRHDTYAIGMTLSGVQTFSYRGTTRICLPGQWHVLHPDELHDGVPGTEDGFAYRIVYVDPALIFESLGRHLPFVADPIVDGANVPRALTRFLQRTDDEDDELAATDVVTVIADMLSAHSSTGRAVTPPVDRAAITRVRESLVDHPTRRYRAADVERIAGMDRWSVARQFRAAFGTSPSRFRSMRQLQVARSLVLRGTPLADAAHTAGFADQAHFTRTFKAAYGLTPAAWAAAVRHNPPVTSTTAPVT